MTIDNRDNDDNHCPKMGWWFLCVLVCGSYEFIRVSFESYSCEFWVEFVGLLSRVRGSNREQSVTP